MGRTVFFLLVILVLTANSGCQTTITQENIQLCRLFCNTRKGVYQFVVDPIKGSGCHCKNGDMLWLEIDERGPFQDERPIDDGNIDTEAEGEFIK